MIEYKCPKCGAEVSTSVKTCIPPIHCYKCNNPNCDYLYEEKDRVITITAPLETDEVKIFSDVLRVDIKKGGESVVTLPKSLKEI